MTSIFFVGLGGALGALMRYGVSRGFISTLGQASAPWATLTVNVLGSFLLGLAYVYLVERQHLPPHLTQAITVGVLGAFTTFSTFSLELFHFISTGRVGLAAAYFLTSVILGLTAVSLGIIIARLSPLT